MERIELELTLPGGRKGMFFLYEFVVCEGEDGSAGIVDGMHNNGGWKVKEKYHEVIDMINKQRKNKKDRTCTKQ